MTRMALVMLMVFGLATASGLAQEGARRSPAPAQATATQQVNLNTAGASQLETLPGIGRVTAERIIEYREKNGGFKKVEDLMNVRGVGEASFLKLRPLVTVTSQ